MATDQELNQAGLDSKEVWSPVHAWRALGQLQALDALKPLLGLLANRDDDWISDDFPNLCTLIGVDSIPLLKEFLADTSHNFFARIDAAQSLEAISHKYPQTRDSNVAAIAGELEKFGDNDPTFNGLLIGILVDLQAVGAIDIMERAFKANQVDTFIGGYWEDIQVELGLKTYDEVSKSRFSENLVSLLSPTRPTKASKGFGSNPSKTKKKKSHKSSGQKKLGWQNALD